MRFRSAFAAFQLGLALATLPPMVYAQTASDSAKEIRDAVAQKVADELAVIKQSVTKKAFIGTISGKTDATITLTNLKNQPRTITVTTDTSIKLVGGSDGTPADLKVGQFVLVIGDVDGNSTMTAKRLLVITKPVDDKRKSVFITLTKVTSSTLTGNNWSIKISPSTKFNGKTVLSDLQVGSKIVVIGVVTDTNVLTAHRILLTNPTVSPTSPPISTKSP